MSAKFFNRALFKGSAKAKLRGNWPVALAITLLYSVFGGFSLVGSQLLPAEEGFVEAVPYQLSLSSDMMGALMGAWALILFSTILVFAHTLAASIWALNLSIGSEAVGIGDFMSGFRYFFKAIGAGLWQILWLNLWGLLFIIPGAVAFVFGAFAKTGMFGTEFTTLGIIAMLIGGVLYLLGLVVVVIKGISYSQMFFVLAEGEIGVLRSMRISKRLTRDYLGDLFVLDLSFILWGLAVIFTAGLAIFYVYPYYLVTTAEAYVYLRDDAFEKGLLDPSEFGLVKATETIPVMTEESQMAPSFNDFEAPEVLPTTEDMKVEDTQVIFEKPLEVNEGSDDMAGLEEPKKYE